MGLLQESERLVCMHPLRGVLSSARAFALVNWQLRGLTGMHITQQGQGVSVWGWLWGVRAACGVFERTLVADRTEGWGWGTLAPHWYLMLRAGVERMGTRLERWTPRIGGL